MRVQDVHRHLRRVPGKILFEHGLVELGIFVTGEANETNLANFTGFERGPERLACPLAFWMMRTLVRSPRQGGRPSYLLRRQAR